MRSATVVTRLARAGFSVSIHALLAECDEVRAKAEGVDFRFNPRTPCGVRRTLRRRSHLCGRFQSTHSLRSATNRLERGNHTRRSFNPRTPCGVRRQALRPSIWETAFQSTHSLRSATRRGRMHLPDLPVSIHALLAECDDRGPGAPMDLLMFQSTHSLRSATRHTAERQ